MARRSGKRIDRPVQLWLYGQIYTTTHVDEETGEEVTKRQQIITFTAQCERWTEVVWISLGGRRKLTPRLIASAWLRLRQLWRRERERQKRCRIRNAAYQQECAKRQREWDGGHRPPPTIIKPGPRAVPVFSFGENFIALLSQGEPVSEAEATPDPSPGSESSPDGS